MTATASSLRPHASLYTGVAILLAVLHWVMAVTAALEKSPTFDEPIHLAAGYSYWLRGDFRLDPENGNLPQRLAALPLLLAHPHFPAPDERAWVAAMHGPMGHELLYHAGNDPEALLARGRMMIALVSASLCLLVYLWATELWGPIGGVIAETLAVFCPTMLAHGALATSDMTLAFFFAAAVWSTWRMLQRTTTARVLVAGLCLGGLFVSKMSAALVVPMIAILFAVQIFCVAKKGERARASVRFAGAMALIAVLIATCIWGSFNFRYSALAPPETFRENLDRYWGIILRRQGPAERVISFARDRRLLPEAYLYGLAYVHHNSTDRPAFLDGRWSGIGFPAFFPKAFLYKTPLPMLALLVLVAALTVRLAFRQRQRLARTLVRAAPVLTLIAIYGAFALATKLNIGQRHLLPIYPALFVACGSCAVLLRERKTRPGAIAVAVLLAWQIGESLASRPDYLAYFNELAGPPAHRHRHLVDSSLDWGQDLPALKQWLDEHAATIHGRPVYFAYFGTGDPTWYRIGATMLPGKMETTDGRFAPWTGGIYCLSATSLEQVYSLAMGNWSEPYERLYQKTRGEMERTGFVEHDKERFALFEELRFARLCAFLRQRKPIADPGHSILIFDLTDADVRQALEGPPVELFPKVQVDGFYSAH